MLSLFRLVSFAILALPLFQLVDAHASKRAPVLGSNGDRLAKRLPLARPKRLYDPHRHDARTEPSGTTTSTSVVSTSSDLFLSSSSLPTSDLPSSILSLSSIPPASPSASASSSTVSSSIVSAPGSSLVSATPSSTTPAPVATRTGYISLEKFDTITPMKKRDTFPGYMGSYGMVPNPPGSSGQTAFVYTYTVPGSASTPVQFNVDMDPTYSGYALGAMSINQFTCPALGTGSTQYLHVQNVHGSTAAGAASCMMMSNRFMNQGFSKTTIFLVDPETDAITVQWINPNGSIVPAYVVEFTNPSWSYAIFITGDLSTLAAALGTSVLNLNVVQLHFNDMSSTASTSAAITSIITI